MAEMSTSAQRAAEMRTGMQAAADQAAKPSILEKLGKKPPQVQGRAKQRTRKHREMDR